MRLAVLCGLGLWAGSTLLFSQLRWFTRLSLADRLRPYSAGGAASSGSRHVLSLESFRDVVGPLCRGIGERLSRALGVTEDVAVRLERLHSPLDVTAFRLRQVGWSVAGFGLAALATVAVRPPPAAALIFLLSGPLLAFLVLEQRLASASAAWKARLFRELPVVAEQLAMLLAAGYSLGGALNRLAARGNGVAAKDLARVCGRIRQGLSEVEALREWATVADVEALTRLLPVLALNREASDLGRLVSEEARAIRRDSHRQLIETIERRSQQVWVPVTVAALVPGILFLVVPFIEALRLYSQS
ncbi:MAG TPA: type II secretion system F family protein [Acidimicrobiales bacterium]|jgi:tight adherence protein C|nr:type II secretion system F family protein [Acidimicrobiales bacterium]